METYSVAIITATLRADASIPPAERSRLLKLIRGESAPVQNDNGHSPRIYSRAECAKLLGEKTTWYVDQLCKRGLLQKLKPKGNVRAIGVTSASLESFIAGT